MWGGKINIIICGNSKVKVKVKKVKKVKVKKVKSVKSRGQLEYCVGSRAW